MKSLKTRSEAHTELGELYDLPNPKDTPALIHETAWKIASVLEKGDIEPRDEFAQIFMAMVENYRAQITKNTYHRNTDIDRRGSELCQILIAFKNRK